MAPLKQIKWHFDAIDIVLVGFTWPIMMSVTTVKVKPHSWSIQSISIHTNNYSSLLYKDKTKIKMFSIWMLLGVSKEAAII